MKPEESIQDVFDELNAAAANGYENLMESELRRLASRCAAPEFALLVGAFIWRTYPEEFAGWMLNVLHSELGPERDDRERV